MPRQSRSSTLRKFALKPDALAWSMALAFAAMPAALQANPTGGVAVHGSATFNTAGSTLTVTTQNGAGGHSVINWQSFSIPQGSTTNFVQPSAASLSINRVVTNTPSQLFGTLSSNGKLVLVNQSGITVGAGAVVDTAGFTASTLGITEADAIAGRLRFSADAVGGNASGKLQVQGNVIARTGDVVLIAPDVEVANTGVVEAPNGTVVLAAGQKVEVTGRGLEGIRLEVQAPGDRATNLGTLKGDAVGIFASQLRHTGLIQATGVTVQSGRVVLKATELAEVDGRIEASRTVNGVKSGGSVSIDAPTVTMNGTVEAKGVTGGVIEVTGQMIAQGATLDASGTAGGGAIRVVAQRLVEQTVSTRLSVDGGSGNGGTVLVQATDSDGSVVSSATIDADGASGGTVDVLAPSIQLQAATITADGTAETNGHGGAIYLGGGKQGGDPLKDNSRFVAINSTTLLSARSRRRGNGGTVVVWSDDITKFSGNINARGGEVSGDGGFVEVSGKEQLVFRGMVNAGATNGANGTLLLDPRDINIEAGTGVATALGLHDNPGVINSAEFGEYMESIAGKLVIGDPGHDGDRGAIYIFDPVTGGLLGTFKGTNAGDRVGESGQVMLNPLNASELFISNSGWNSSRGAITFYSLAAPTVGVVSSGTSFIGSTAGDMVGSGGYIVISGTSTQEMLLLSPEWGGTRGAIIKVAGSGTRSGVVGTGNAMVGAAAGEYFGSYGNTSFFESYGESNAFVLVSHGYGGNWGAVLVGHVGSAFTGTVGAGTALVGNANGRIASAIGVDFAHGYALVGSQYWGDAGGSNKGAVTRISLSAPTTGLATSVNSLVGSVAGDAVSSGGIYLNNDGSYLVVSPNWGDAQGAVTWGAIGTGVTGLVNATPVTGNSLVGGMSGVSFGADASMLEGGNRLLVLTPNWTDDGTSNKGAITLINPKVKMPGVVSAANSVVGSSMDDYVGCRSECGEGGSDSLTAIGNGWYAVHSGGWSNGKGAITFLYAGTGSVQAAAMAPRGVVEAGSTTNLSLVGQYGYGEGNCGEGCDSFYGDGVGSSRYAIHVNYYDNNQVAVLTPEWNDARGAVTVLNLSTMTSSIEVGESTSVVGSTGWSDANYWGTNPDRIGSNGFWASSSRYVIVASDWNLGRGAVAAVTAGTFGQLVYDVDALHGSIGYDNAESYGPDRVGSGLVTTLRDSDLLLISSPHWNERRGAITVMRLGEVSGAVSVSNSMVGEDAEDDFGITDHSQFVDRSYWDDRIVVASPEWRDGRGAITWITLNDGASVGDTVSSSTNSLVGASGYGSGYADRVGSGGFVGPNSANYMGTDLPYDLALSPSWGNSPTGSKGAITRIDLDPVPGIVGATNSFVGANHGDSITLNWNYGDNRFDNAWSDFGNGAWILRTNFNDGAEKIAYTVFAPDSTVTGTVGTGNSIIESAGAFENGGKLVTDYWSLGDRAVLYMPNWNGGMGAIRVIDTSATESAGVTAEANTGATSSENALTGSLSGDQIGGGFLTYGYLDPELYLLGSGKVLIFSPQWGGTFGAVTLLDVYNPIVGEINASNSLVGASAGDFGGSSAQNLDFRPFNNGNFVVMNRYFGSGQGALTFFDINDPTVGTVGAGNSLVGGDGALMYENYRAFEIDGRNAWVFTAPNWTVDGNSMGYAVLFTSSGGPVGVVSGSNALVGTANGDHVGDEVWDLGSGRFVVSSPDWAGGSGIQRGALTWGTTSSALTGEVGAGNSIIGAYDYDRVGSSVGEGGMPIGELNGGDGVFYILTPGYNNGHGAYSFVNFGDTGTIADLNTITNDYANGMWPRAWDGSDLHPLLVAPGMWAVRFYSGETSEESGRVFLTNGLPGVGGYAPDQLFGDTPDQDITITTGSITAITNTGTDVILQANNDINVNGAIVTTGANPGGAITLEAGRSVNINASITTNNGDLTIIANSASPNMQSEFRDEGYGEIYVAHGATVNFGSGTAVLRVDEGGVEAGSIVVEGTVRGTGALTLQTPQDIYIRGLDGLALVEGGNVTVNANWLMVHGKEHGAQLHALSSLDVNVGYLEIAGGLDGGEARMRSEGTMNIAAANNVYVNAEGAGSALLSSQGHMYIESGGGVYVESYGQSGTTTRIVAGSLEVTSDAGLAIRAYGDGDTSGSAGVFVTGNLSVDAEYVQLQGGPDGGYVQMVVGGNASINTYVGEGGMGLQVIGGEGTGASASLAVLGSLTVQAPVIMVAAFQPGATLSAGSLDFTGEAMNVSGIFGAARVSVAGLMKLTLSDMLGIGAYFGSASVTAGSAEIAADYAVVDAGYGPASLTTTGALSLTANSLEILGGEGTGGHASIASGGNAVIHAGNINIEGGTGTGAYALLDPLLPGSTMQIESSSITLTGGEGAGAYAAIVSRGGPLTFTGTLPTITFNTGMGAGADAVIVAPNGAQLASLFAMQYLGETNPLPNSLTEFGFATYIEEVTYSQDFTDLLAGMDWMTEFLTPEQRRNRGGADIVFEICLPP